MVTSVAAYEQLVKPMILKNIIESTMLEPEFCADLLGVASDQFEEWLTGARPLPRFVIPEISSILGVTEKTLLQVCTGTGMSCATLAPAIWYKLRDSKLVQADREMVALVRKLGYYMDQLATVRGEKLRRFEPLFRGIREKVDRTAPPALQGKEAAHEFRSMTDLEHGQAAIGEWIRPTLRKLGVLTLESPLKSAVEGCAFSVGSVSGPTPCVFANSYKSTWFRRNAIIMHEVGHAIFDLEATGLNRLHSRRQRRAQGPACTGIRSGMFGSQVGLGPAGKPIRFKVGQPGSSGPRDPRRLLSRGTAPGIEGGV